MTEFRDISSLNSDFKTFHFLKNEMLAARTGTDGFQPKFFTKDRQYFVKTQAVISGIPMQDWLVEIIASDFCEQLHIPCIQQHPCIVEYAGHEFFGVYSKNFELEGYTFLSFESLLNRYHLSSKDDYFIKLPSEKKLKWCAEKLSVYGKLPFNNCLHYMLNLAVIDCLTGNTDRHTRNFGLFYHPDHGFCIPLIFDSGMGLFEHDYYRDHYKTFDDAMMNVYVSPYGEDPFDMAALLKQAFPLSTYEFQNLKLPEIVPNKFSIRYLEQILHIFL